MLKRENTLQDAKEIQNVLQMARKHMLVKFVALYSSVCKKGLKPTKTKICFLQYLLL